MTSNIKVQPTCLAEAVLLHKKQRDGRTKQDNGNKENIATTNAITTPPIAASHAIPVKKHESTTNTPIPSVFAVPRDDKLSCYSGLFRTSVVVKQDRFIMYYDGASSPVLRADKQLSLKVLPKYYVFDISQVQEGGGLSLSLDKDSPQYIGKLKRDSKNLNRHAFVSKSKGAMLHSRQSFYMLYDFFDDNTCTDVFKGKMTPRRVRLALYNESSNVCTNGSALAKTFASSSLNHVTTADSSVHVFTSKEPYKNKEDNYALNFFGRRQLPSAANMQLQDNKGRVIVQLGMTKENAFNLDFRAPFNAVQAFHFAIAQICEY